jgi:hypothetical protein
MKSPPSSISGRSWLFVLLVAQTVLFSGCTTALWDKETFARHYRPADPINLHLFYSMERKDILVQYDESGSWDDKIRPRCYWLEPNMLRVNRERKPHFVSSGITKVLIPIPVIQAAASPAQPCFMGLYAVAPHDGDYFTLYSPKEQLEQYKLPAYIGSSRRVKQVFLTPFAVGVDTTIIGAVIGYSAAPGMFAGLCH